MDILNQLIGSLTKDEQREFKLYTSRYKNFGERKDLKLFDYIKKSGEKFKDDLIFQKLYDGDDKNSYYRLKNRLLDDISGYLCLHHSGKNDLNDLYRLLGLYEIYLIKLNFRISYFYLKKAEKRALLINNYEMLDVVYANYIRLSNDIQEINPELYIAKQKENTIQLNKVREMDQTFAAINYRLRYSQNFGSKDQDLVTALDKTVKEFSSDTSLDENKAFQTKIFAAVSLSLIRRHEFKQLEKYMLNVYQKFSSRKWFDRQNHELKLQMLVYCINALFKNDKFEKSLVYAELLGNEIESFDKLLYDKYVFFYYNSLVINYSKIDIKRAFDAVNELETIMRKKKVNFHDQFIYLNKATLLYDQKKYNEGIRNLVKLYLNDSFKKADDGFKLKICIAELIMHLESKDYETTLTRIEQVESQFERLIISDDFVRDRQIIGFIKSISESPKVLKEATFLQELQQFYKTKVDSSVEDSEVLQYRNWIKTKI